MTSEELLQKRKRLRRELLQQPGLQDLRIAVLGGVTTNELVDLLEILLLREQFRPVFYQSEYNKFFEDAVVDSEALRNFKPDLVYVATHWMNIQHFPGAATTEADFQKLLEAELARFGAVWESIGREIGCQVIQNNFELPPIASLGNLDCVAASGRTRFVNELNAGFARTARQNRRLLIHDLNSLAAQLGASRWHDWTRWYSYKIPITTEASLLTAESLVSMVKAVLGRAKKCLILDLDNTLWGGVIGDDGPEKLQIGKETAVAEAYTAFQQYCLGLRERGILLAVCSKNNEDIAHTGLSHPASVLKLEHFAAFKANWEPKHENIQNIARELNLGLDSFVFIDDNPAERELVRAQLPMVLTPEVGSDVSLFPAIIQGTRCFEAVNLSKEDLARADSYTTNAAREKLQAKFANYGEYLDSLQMRAEIEVFQPVYLDRIAQLINKTNQFNLTTRRYTYAEVAEISENSQFVPLYGTLTDVYGDNGLISVLIGRHECSVLHLDLWLMSCRVLKREMEFAMLDALVRHGRRRGIETIIGYYHRTPKNGMVEQHYKTLGFAPESSNSDGSTSVWTLNTDGYKPLNTHIAVSQKDAERADYDEHRNYSRLAAGLR